MLEVVVDTIVQQVGCSPDDPEELVDREAELLTHPSVERPQDCGSEVLSMRGKDSPRTVLRRRRPTIRKYPSWSSGSFIA